LKNGQDKVQEEDVVTQEEEQMLQNIFPSFQTPINVTTMTQDSPRIGGVPQEDVDNIERILRIVRVIILFRAPPLPIYATASVTTTATR